MKRTSFWKKFLASFMALALVLTTIAINDTQASAATKKKVTLSATSKTVLTGKSFTLKVKKVSGLKSSKVKFKSSNSKVAKVSTGKAVKSVKVKGVKAGKATITATSTVNKKVKATCKVTVKQAVTKVKLSKSKATLATGKKLTLKATVSPKKAANKKVTWTSSNKKVATVSKKGVVTAKSKTGTVTITAKAADGSGKKAKCKVTVVRKATGVKVAPTRLTLNEGKLATVKATVAPSNATSKKVTWKSSNKKVAIVSSKGVVKAVKAGTATITATTADGSKKVAKCTVKVVKPAIKVAPATVTLEEGKTATVKVAVVDALGTTVKWATSNKAVAIVSSKGVIKAVKAGTATITATSKSGKKATVKVTVKAKAPVVPADKNVVTKTETQTTWAFDKSAKVYNVSYGKNAFDITNDELASFVGNTQDLAILLSANGSMVYSDDANKSLEMIWNRINPGVLTQVPGVKAATVNAFTAEDGQRIKEVTITKETGNTVTYELVAPAVFTGKDEGRYININKIGTDVKVTLYGMWISVNKDGSTDVYFNIKNSKTNTLVSGGEVKLYVSADAKVVSLTENKLGGAVLVSLADKANEYEVVINNNFAQEMKELLGSEKAVTDLGIIEKY